VRVVKGAASRHKTVLLAVPQADPALLLRQKSPASGD